MCILLAALCLAACATPEPQTAPPPVLAKPSAATAPAAPAAAAASAAPAPVAAPALPPLLPYDEAVLRAAQELLTRAALPAGERVAVVVDPLIDGISRAQTRSTQAIEARLGQEMKTRLRQLELLPFTATNLGQATHLVIGTFTPINQQGKPEGERESYRFCLAMIELKSQRLVSKTAVRALREKVDASPLPYFQDAPIWARDVSGEAYVRSCQALKMGEAADPAYVAAWVQAASLNEGIRAYNARQYREALALFERVRQSTGTVEVRALTGAYLANLRLNRGDAAAAAFGQLLDQGLQGGSLAVLFQFRPGAAQLVSERKLPQETWLKLLAHRLQGGSHCAEVAGHSSRDGPEVINERLSSLRAEHVRKRLAEEAPALDKRLLAVGYGSREAKIGTARGDASDALDRRVEIRPLACK